ncbi:MAG TPA: TolC family protein [Firmicutes bacterium]|nr:TolC family protein [Bacillota bacterium]
MKKAVLQFVLIVLLSIYVSGLSLQEARMIGIENNRDLKIKELAYDSAQWSYYESLSKIFPKLSVSGTYTEYDPDRTLFSGSIFQNSAESYGLTLTQPVFSGGALYYGSRIQKSFLNLTRYDLKKQRIATIADIEQKYLTVLENKELLEAARKDLELTRLSFETAEIKFNLGTISKAEYLNVKSQAASKEVTVISRENQFKISKLALANYLQINEAFEVQSVPFESYENYINLFRDISPEAQARILDKLLSHGLENNPTIKMTEISSYINKMNVNIARSSLFPSANLSYSRRWDKADYEPEFTDQGVTMLTVSFPIFSITSNLSKINRAKNTLTESRLNEENIRESTQLQIKQQFYNMLTSARSVHSARLALEFAQETYEQTDIRYQSNMSSTKDLLDAELLLINTRNQYIISFYNFLRAKSLLLQLLGEEEESFLFEFFND